ncbi:acyltransferase [uncultured Roseobacter sp.]|nr:acyltransferase [uncultured Roseobacter sp.]
MFGLFRTYLALWVVASHIIALPFVGHYAVHGFFILSGYLMALVMNGVYGYSPQGTATFALNRILRLFPSYWVVLILTVGVVLILGEEVTSTYRPAIFLPTTAAEWLQNITMIFASWIPLSVQPRLAPATWALTIELFYYALIGLGLFRWRHLTWAVFILSLGYHITTIALELRYGTRYAFIVAGALPFSIGGLIYHYRFWFEQRSPDIRLTYLLFIPLFALLPAIASWLRQQGIDYPASGMFYVNMALNAVAVGWLAKPSQRFDSPADRFIGDFSYHIYIAHWTAALIAAHYIVGVARPNTTLEGGIVFVLAVLICAGLSLVLRRYVDAPVEQLRTAAKRRRAAPGLDQA